MLHPSNKVNGREPISEHPQDAQRGRRLWTWIAGGIVLSVGLLALIALWPRDAEPYSAETEAGVRRAIALEDGSSIVLNGASRIRLDHADPRTAMLEQGEALLAVAGNGTVFHLTAGPVVIESAGGRFATVREGDHVSVAVDRGDVVVDAGHGPIRLGSGQWLELDGKGTEEHRLAIAGASVAAWKTGRLAWQGQPMRVVAADLARYYGFPVRADAALAETPFTGEVELYPDGNVARMGARLGVRVERKGVDWVLVPIR